jgi:DNA-binding CsgD family transcriptional regulator
MTASVPESAWIFICYRREETAYPASWLFDRLTDHFGEGKVFKDVDSIRPGDDFVEEITAAVESCAVLLAVIGRRWLTVTGEEGRRCLDDPADFVRLEIEAALTRDVRVIPVLMDEARMPSAAELPTSLEKLARRQAVELSPHRFNSDVGRLLRLLDTLSDATARPAQQSAGAGRLGDGGGVPRYGRTLSHTNAIALDAGVAKPDPGARPAVTIPAAGQATGDISSAPLSEREREIVALLAGGATDAQIGERLFLSVTTVRSHLDRIRDKAGTRRRAELVRYAIQAGIDPVAPST